MNKFHFFLAHLRCRCSFLLSTLVVMVFFLPVKPLFAITPLDTLKFANSSLTTPLLSGALQSSINLDANRMEFVSRDVIEPLAGCWGTSRAKPFVIAHFGDSHVQSGYLAEAVRETLQTLRSNGGRGMIFPYSIAKTYSQNDYNSSFTGKWFTANSIQPKPKLPLGVAGFVATTIDSTASFSFKFKRSLPQRPTRLRLFYRTGTSNTQVRLTTAAGENIMSLTMAVSDSISCTDFMASNPGSELRFDVIRDASDSSPFELHGVSIEYEGEGVVYHNLGVGGSVFNALNQQRYFATQIGEISPDLYILDWGTNDILYKNSVPDNFADVAVATISKIRRATPNAAIMLISSQDMNYHHKNVTAAYDLSLLLRSIALAHGCLFYDWYQIAGGAQSMSRWVADGYASKDNIHLTSKGYRLKGKLLGAALLDAIQPSPKPFQDVLPE